MSSSTTTGVRRFVLWGRSLRARAWGCSIGTTGPGLPADVKGDPWVVVVVGAVFAFIGISSTLFCLFAKSTLRLIPRELHRYTTLFGWRIGEKRLSSHAIEEVVVRKDQQGNFGLHVSGDTGSLKFGTQVLRAARILSTSATALSRPWLENQELQPAPSDAPGRGGGVPNWRRGSTPFLTEGS